MQMLDVRSMATNAGKMACYAPMHSGVRMRFGDLEQCLDAAISGEWRRSGSGSGGSNFRAKTGVGATARAGQTR